MNGSFGPAYEEELDGERLRRQHVAIRELMLDNKWRSLSEIAHETGYPEASVSAQLRHLRKPEFGSYTVEKRRRTTGTWEYCVRDQRFQFINGQGLMFDLPSRAMVGH